MIGRKPEQEKLLRRYRRNKAEFVAVYGRRRVGKTTLITETFQNHFAFHHSGLIPAENEQEEKRYDRAQSEDNAMDALNQIAGSNAGEQPVSNR